MNRNLPEPLLERLHQGDLPPEAAEALEARLTAEDRARLAALSADDAATLLTHPPARVAAAVHARAGRSPSTRAWALPVGAVGVAAAAAALVFALLRPTTPAPGVLPGDPGTPETASADVRAKGDDRLLVFRRTSSAAEPLPPGAVAAAGDELRLGVLLDAPARAVIVSFDGRGAVTRHVPVGEMGDTRGAPAVLPRGRTLLDFAYALDDAPAFERFVLVTGPDVTPGPVEAAARALAVAPDAETRPLTLPAGWRQVDFLIRKPRLEPPPARP
jgi:hypothetical protein